MTIWTSEFVIEFLENAVNTSKLLPKVKVQGYVSMWPEIYYSMFDIYFMDKIALRIKPSSFEITCFDNVLEWISILDTKEERKLVWLRAAKMPWKKISLQFDKKTRQTLWVLWKSAINKIVEELNDTNSKFYNKNRMMLKRYI